MKKLPTGIQSITKVLDRDEYVYVDKTHFIKQLIDSGSPHYFISRPRRFGKSLFVSTLEEIFRGNKEVYLIGKNSVSAGASFLKTKISIPFPEAMSLII